MPDSEWIWSDEHGDYYKAVYGPDGRVVRYVWGRATIPSEPQTRTHPQSPPPVQPQTRPVQPSASTSSAQGTPQYGHGGTAAGTTGSSTSHGQSYSQVPQTSYGQGQTQGYGTQAQPVQYPYTQPTQQYYPHGQAAPQTPQSRGTYPSQGQYSYYQGSSPSSDQTPGSSGSYR